MLIIRIDDFVSGIRPIEKDLSNFFKVFDLFEENEIVFHVGIVPALLKYVSKSDIQKLLSYRFLVPCQHGYEHRYSEMSRKLIRAGDPQNVKTIGVFNEFEGKGARQIINDLTKGRGILQKLFGKEIKHYIPVCNTIDKNLMVALNSMEYEYIFTVEHNKGAVSGQIKTIFTEFNGRLFDIKDKSNNSFCLHITWENDAIKERGWEAWKNKFYEVFGTDMNTENKVEGDNTIPHIANFYWNNETPLSYLRYLTVCTFRHFHPDWVIKIWLSDSNIKNVWQGFVEKQDFQGDNTQRNYLFDLIKFDVQFLQFKDDTTKDLAPNYISDIARFKTIFNGGWFFDLDQIFTHNFDDLCNNHFVTGYGNNNRIHCGAIGASKISLIPKHINERQLKKLSKSTFLNGYCELGNHFLHDFFNSVRNVWQNLDTSGYEITDSKAFYPIATSADVDILYEGKMIISELENNYAVHWYGGHQKSQLFNSKYTEEFARHSMDSISVYLRKIGIVK